MNELFAILAEGIFYPFKDAEVYDRNAVDYHAMSGSHTEILGQFIDYTGMDSEQLKECLIYGYIHMQGWKHGE